MTPLLRKQTVGLIIIGDEILNGRVEDTNSRFALKQFFQWGAKVKRITVLPDEIESISDEVAKFAEMYDFVVTTGGIGPTDDDVTYRAVAKAFKTEVKLNDELVQAVDAYFGKKDENDSIYRLATIPSNSKLLWNEKRDYPIVVVNNVFVLPGVPQIFERIFPNIKSYFRNGVDHSVQFSKFVYIDRSEMEVANEINQVFKNFESEDVHIGSYPNFANNYYKVKITIDAANQQLADEVEAFLRNRLPGKSIREKFVEDCVALLPQSVYDFDSQLVRRSLQVIEEALSKYSPKNVVLSFNGGKDCTLLLHMYAAVLKKYYPDERVNLLFIETEESFEEMMAFIEATKTRYPIGAFYHIKSSNIIEGLKSLGRENPNIFGIILGTRSTDPGGKGSSEFFPCDPQYGNFMRINPILNWTYADVWSFIRTLQVPYCVLYDQGYTSLGFKSRTKKNPELYLETRGKRDVYRPAYTLENGETERSARD